MESPFCTQPDHKNQDSSQTPSELETFSMFKEAGNSYNSYHLPIEVPIITAEGWPCEMHHERGCYPNNGPPKFTDADRDEVRSTFKEKTLESSKAIPQERPVSLMSKVNYAKGEWLSAEENKLLQAATSSTESVLLHTGVSNAPPSESISTTNGSNNPGYSAREIQTARRVHFASPLAQFKSPSPTLSRSISLAPSPPISEAPWSPYATLMNDNNHTSAGRGRNQAPNYPYHLHQDPQDRNVDVSPTKQVVYQTEKHEQSLSSRSALETQGPVTTSRERDERSDTSDNSRQNQGFRPFLLKIRSVFRGE